MDQQSEIRQALEHLAEAQRHVQRAGAVSGDWTAKTVIESQFDGLREEIADFARNLGVDAD